MSKCISSYGEYSSHEPRGDGYEIFCEYCGEPDMDAIIAAAEKRGAVASIRYAAMEKVGGFARDRLLTYADQLEGDSNAE